MISRLSKDKFKRRIPLYIRMKNGILYYQLQVDIARADGLRYGIYCEFSKIETSVPLNEIGAFTLEKLERFHQLADLTPELFFEMTGLDNEAYENKEMEDRLDFLGVKKLSELDSAFESCSICYELNTGIYEFELCWKYKEGRRCYLDSSDSSGKTGILTFAEKLEFDNNISTEKLGQMVLEAFERGRKITDKLAGNNYPSKDIELLDETSIEVTFPGDEHFVDYDDAGSGEVYQLYSYIAKDGEDSSADFSLDTAPELYHGLSCEGIHRSWTEAFGDGEITVTEKCYGIFKYCAEFRSKKYYRIAYFAACNDDLLLECSMDVKDPDKKKKLINTLVPLFEQFALGCKRKK